MENLINRETIGIVSKYNNLMYGYGTMGRRFAEVLMLTIMKYIMNEMSIAIADTTPEAIHMRMLEIYEGKENTITIPATLNGLHGALILRWDGNDWKASGNT